jgi:hypothetical protein
VSSSLFIRAKPTRSGTRHEQKLLSCRVNVHSQIAATPPKPDRNVVGHDLYSDHGESLALGRIDFARRDRGSRLIRAHALLGTCPQQALGRRISGPPMTPDQRRSVDPSDQPRIFTSEAILPQHATGSSFAGRARLWVCRLSSCRPHAQPKSRTNPLLSAAADLDDNNIQDGAAAKEELRS